MSHLIAVPSVGGVTNLDVVELLVKPGEVISIDQAIAVVESDKSSLEIVSDKQGRVQKWLVTQGQRVSPGTPLLEIEEDDAINSTAVPAPVSIQQPLSHQISAVTPAVSQVTPSPQGPFYASPAVRQMARHFDIPLEAVTPTGERGRIVIADLKRYIDGKMAAVSPKVPENLLFDPELLPDKAYWGACTPKALSKIKRITAQRLSEQWRLIPHVTQFNQAVIDDLQEFRGRHKEELAQEGFKLTLLPFIIQAVCRSLKEFPQFNAVLSADGAKLIELSAINIGVAVQTEQGLMVPVLHQASGQTVRELTSQLQLLSQKARAQKLLPAESQGHTFTISSLGGFGGTAFTPIINPPNIAILGVSRSYKRYGPSGTEQEVLPLSLSYDHRVIDGVEGAQFLESIVEGLEDLRLLCLG
jgi:pyruvate dehydrogenase E2 component (dihydrolipoamide acetyltransferase)